MNRFLLFRLFATLLIVTGIILSLASCGIGGGGEPENAITVSYTTPFIPVTFSLDSNGNIGVSTGVNIVTELGEFSVHVGSPISAFAGQANDLVITIRHYENGNLVDTGYQITSGSVGSADIQGNINEVNIAWNGQSNTIFIDASNGDITSIVIQGNASSTTSTVPASSPTNPPTTGPTQPPPQACSNTQGQRGTDHQADGTDWPINSLGGGAFIVNFYFPNTQYNGNNKLLVPEGYTTLTLHGGGGSYWLWPTGCADIVQQNYDTLDSYTPASLQDLENQGLVSIS